MGCSRYYWNTPTEEFVFDFYQKKLEFPFDLKCWELQKVFRNFVISQSYLKGEFPGFLCIIKTKWEFPTLLYPRQNGPNHIYLFGIPKAKWTNFFCFLFFCLFVCFCFVFWESPSLLYLLQRFVYILGEFLRQKWSRRISNPSRPIGGVPLISRIAQLETKNGNIF